MMRGRCANNASAAALAEIICAQTGMPANGNMKPTTGCSAGRTSSTSASLQLVLHDGRKRVAIERLVVMKRVERIASTTRLPEHGHAEQQTPMPMIRAPDEADQHVGHDLCRTSLRSADRIDSRLSMVPRSIFPRQPTAR